MINSDYDKQTKVAELQLVNLDLQIKILKELRDYCNNYNAKEKANQLIDQLYLQIESLNKFIN